MERYKIKKKKTNPRTLKKRPKDNLPTLEGKKEAPSRVQLESALATKETLVLQEDGMGLHKNQSLFLFQGVGGAKTTDSLTRNPFNDIRAAKSSAAPFTPR